MYSSESEQCKLFIVYVHVVLLDCALSTIYRLYVCTHQYMFIRQYVLLSNF